MQTEPVLEIDDNGSKRWYSNGKIHREDGPAIERTNGDKFWLLNDQLHRTDGPAVERPNGDKGWWLNGKKYNFEEWLKSTPISSQEKIKLRLKYAK